MQRGLNRRSVIAGALAASTPLAARAKARWTDGSFLSADGARIHFRVRGAGSPVLVVHGAFDRPQDWYPVADRLADRHRFYLLRRRGWLTPPPDDGSRPYEREKADIARLLRIAGHGCALFGHSAGGALVADFARTRQAPARVILFDPALPLGGPVAGPRLAVMRRLVGEGRSDDAFRLFLAEIVQLPAAEIDGFAATPGWRRQASMMPQCLRELSAIDALPSDPRAYRAITAPTFLIESELSPDHPFHDAIRALAAVLPRCRLLLLRGQGHMGMASAPDQFANVLEDSLSSAL
ncbi:MAG TPA: alpha/beta hydrolase [Caulobacteraceae bacterium]|jgi:pimeloyl-ACP methyl ester carboxylesterase